MLDQLRQLAPVSEVIGKRISIKRHGREFHALCPFHKEKTPSFTINDEKHFFHCFGCGAHGDAIGFIKDYENLSYKEAIERLAEEVNFSLPKPSPEMERRYKRERSLQDVTEAACAWFQKQLMANGGEGARDYVRTRGMSRGVVAGFRIGYAPEDRNALEQALLAQGFTQAQMIEAGLLIRVDGKAPYSRFRRRLMFPITNISGEVVAFGGRVLPDEPSDNAPKYLNSPETPIFHKGQQLYNFDRARRAAREHSAVVVCEGYMDVIALAQAGIEYAVAPLGTAMTQQQLQLLWTVADEPVLCLDGDNAGERAMQRAADLAFPMLLPQKSLRFVRLPAGEDPDTIVKQEGAEAFVSRMGNAVSLSDTLWSRLVSEFGDTPEQRAGLEKACMQRVGQVQDASVQAHYRRFYQDKLWQLGRSKPQGKQATKVQSAMVLPALPSAKDGESQRQKVQHKLLCLVACAPQLLEQAEREEWFASLDMLDAEVRRWRDALLHLLVNNPAPSVEDVSVALEASGEGRWEAWFEREKLAVPRMVRDGAAGYEMEAGRLWQKWEQSHGYLQLSEEVEQAKRAMAEEMSEENYARFSALMQQLRIMEQHRGQFFEDSVEAG